MFPIFPLNGAILFPGTNLPLNIFEEKYIQMVDYALSNNRVIGMIQKKENKEFFNIGCLGKITNFTETDDGRYQINLQGVSRFRFKKILKNDYKFITIDADILKENKVIKNKDVTNKKLLSSFNKFLKLKKINFDTSEFINLNSSNLAKIICVISPLDYLIKQMLLEFDSDDDLCKNLLSVLEIEMQNSENNYKVN
ncbi:LON peptidase substrate-binding domain-containing protein [Alphaproteobacteria bacterium]|nr:LON peptidase substrate-binding domain-containing protein [Alphaproteobacteria bacterium]